MSILAAGYQDLQLCLANSLATRGMAGDMLRLHTQLSATRPSASMQVCSG